ncbi:hypothetical protein ACQP2F_45385 [Actinoplanes sp. CA-030573]|uniref:hypothetical protein n=1 Tax=Actinoplanes sp. CA-030573 TaxID=3239898 RepID=UPI003D8D09D8
MADARFRIVRHRPDGSLSWRLLATNNRDIGRSPVRHPDVEACRAAVRDLQLRLGRARTSIVRAEASSWSWRIAVGDVVVAVSSRDYQRRIQAEQAAGIALALIPAAAIVEPA